MRSIDSQLDFDLTLATEKSNENPVYYIQYAHARICSIFRQLKEAGIEEAAEADYTLLTDPAEIELIKKLGEYPELIARQPKSARYTALPIMCMNWQACSIPSITSAAFLA